MDTDYLDEGFGTENYQQSAPNSAPKRNSASKRKSVPPTDQLPPTPKTPFKLTLADMSPVPPGHNFNTPLTGQKTKVRIFLNAPEQTAHSSNSPSNFIIKPPATEMTPSSTPSQMVLNANLNVSPPQQPSSPTNLEKFMRGAIRYMKEETAKQNVVLNRIEKFLIDKEPKSAPVRIIWPVQDINQLNAIEDKLASDDEDVKRSLTKIWENADKTNLYKFVSTNLRNLLRQTGRWTWTGRPSNATPNAPESGCAKTLKSVTLLKELACNLFAPQTEDDVIRACKNTLCNTNDITRKAKLKKERLQKVVNQQTD